MKKLLLIAIGLLSVGGVFGELKMNDWQIYRNNTPIEWIDQNTFEEIEAIYIYGWRATSMYAKDKNGVYYPNDWKFKKLDWASAEDLVILDNLGDELSYALSNWSLYYQWIDVWLDNILDAKIIEWRYVDAWGVIVYNWSIVNNIQWFNIIDINELMLGISRPKIYRPFCLSQSWEDISFNNILYVNDYGDIFFHWKKIPILKWSEEIVDNMSYGQIDNGLLALRLDNCWNKWYEFVTDRSEKINIALIDKIVPILEKEKLKQLLDYKIATTTDYRYGTMSEAIEWTFYRHILRNLDMYYE